MDSYAVVRKNAEISCNHYPVSPMVSSCKTVVQPQHQDIGTDTVKKQNSFMTAKTPHGAHL